MQQVTGFDLGCGLFDPAHRQLIDTIIPRNTKIPARRTITYYTNRVDQSRISLDIVQVKAPGEPVVSLGQFAFPIDRQRKNHPLEITVGYDEHGLVSVVARDLDTGREVKWDCTGSAHPMDRILAQKAPLDSVPLCE